VSSTLSFPRPSHLLGSSVADFEFLSFSQAPPQPLILNPLFPPQQRRLPQLPPPLPPSASPPHLSSQPSFLPNPLPPTLTQVTTFIPRPKTGRLTNQSTTTRSGTPGRRRRRRARRGRKGRAGKDWTQGWERSRSSRSPIRDWEQAGVGCWVLRVRSWM